MGTHEQTYTDCSKLVEDLIRDKYDKLGDGLALAQLLLREEILFAQDAVRALSERHNDTGEGVRLRAMTAGSIAAWRSIEGKLGAYRAALGDSNGGVDALNRIMRGAQGGGGE